jgi:hypothetical protein
VWTKLKITSFQVNHRQKLPQQDIDFSIHLQDPQESEYLLAISCTNTACYVH